MATMSGIVQVSLATKSTTCPPSLSSVPVETSTLPPTQEFYDNLLGMTGVAITLSIISSGAYVLLRYLL
jgi:hypothetical protein